MLNVVDAAGNLLAANGLAGFNNNWGACCARAYDLSYAEARSVPEPRLVGGRVGDVEVRRLASRT
jgi:hypothetical protein